MDRVKREYPRPCAGRPNGVPCMVLIPRDKPSGLCYGCERDLWRTK